MKRFDINSDEDMGDGAEHMYNLLTDVLQQCGASAGFIVLLDKDGKPYSMAVPNDDPEGLFLTVRGVVDQME